MKNILYTLATGGAVLGTGLAATAAAAASFVGPAPADAIIRVWARSILTASGIQDQVLHAERMPAGTCVLVSNHQSHFDVLVVLANLHKHIRFVAKRSLFQIPIFGQALRLTGNLEVDRKGGEKDRQTLRDAVEKVQRRVSVMFFPEGSRSEDGQLMPFKKGAAVLAINAQVPLLPMAVAGTRHILPKGTKTIHGGQRAVLAVGEPISTSGLTLADRDTLTEKARVAVAALQAEAESVYGGQS